MAARYVQALRLSGFSRFNRRQDCQPPIRRRVTATRQLQTDMLDGGRRGITSEIRILDSHSFSGLSWFCSCFRIVADITQHRLVGIGVSYRWLLVWLTAQEL